MRKSSTVRICVARHGQNEDNARNILNGHRDLPLTKIGIEQAHALAEGILDHRLTFDAVYVSPLVRAHTTANIVCTRLGLQSPTVLPKLIELDMGTMAGKTIQEMRDTHPSEKKLQGPMVTWFLDVPGAESYADCLVRAGEVIDFVHERHEEGRVLLVCHGTIGHMMYGAYHGLDWRDALTSFHFGNAELLELSGDADSTAPHLINLEQHND